MGKLTPPRTREMKQRRETISVAICDSALLPDLRVPFIMEACNADPSAFISTETTLLRSSGHCEEVQAKNNKDKAHL